MTMTREEFEDVLLQIYKFYPKNNQYNEMSDFEEDLWYRSLSGWSKKHFEDVAEECFRTKKYMPKLADILECEKTMPKPAIENKKMQYYHCDKCLSTGVIKYYVRENGVLYDFFARCDCKNAENYMNFPTASEAGFKVTVYEKDGAVCRKFEHKNGKTKEQIIRYNDPEKQAEYIKQVKESLIKMLKKV